MALLETPTSIPTPLMQAIHAAEQVLQHQPQGHLPLCLRRQIELQMGAPHWEEDGTPRGTGWKRRVHLAILSAQHVQPFWEAALPGDDGVTHMVQLAQTVVEGRISALDANQQMGDFWTLADNCRYQLRRRAGNSSPACAGHAAAAAVAVALADKQGVDCISDQDDESSNYYDWDVSYFAAIAYANGGLSNQSSDIEKRREFWQWYLQEAVPDAYCSITEVS